MTTAHMETSPLTVHCLKQKSLPLDCRVPLLLKYILASWFMTAVHKKKFVSEKNTAYLFLRSVQSLSNV